jgi:hypothetical protein
MPLKLVAERLAARMLLKPRGAGILPPLKRRPPPNVTTFNDARSATLQAVASFDHGKFER